MNLIHWLNRYVLKKYGNTTMNQPTNKQKTQVLGLMEVIVQWEKQKFTQIIMQIQFQWNVIGRDQSREGCRCFSEVEIRAEVRCMRAEQLSRHQAKHTQKLCGGRELWGIARGQCAWNRDSRMECGLSSEKRWRWERHLTLQDLVS